MTEIRTPLELWYPHGGTGDSKQPLDPARCPVQVSVNMGRWYAAKQCENKPRADKVRPVRDYRVSGKQDGEKDMPVCGRHSSQYDREVERQEQTDASRVREQERQAQAGRLIDRLAAYGISAGASTEHQTYSTNGLRLSFAEAEKLVALLDIGTGRA